MKKATAIVLGSALLLSGVSSVGAIAVNTSDRVTPEVIGNNPYSQLGWIWPTDVNTITGAYGESRPDGPHKGIDIGTTDGHPVTAVQAGVVLSSGAYTDGTNYVHIQTKDRVSTSYNLITRQLHLQSYSVYGGNSVTRNQIVGKSGHTGGVDTHLHFDVNDQGTQYPNYSQTVDPGFFWPSRFPIAGIAAPDSSSDTAEELEKYADPENFFDHYLIQQVGEQAFNNWLQSTPMSERKLSKFKKHFNISEKDAKDILDKGRKNTEEKQKAAHKQQ